MHGCISIKVIIIHNPHFDGPREGFNCNTFWKFHSGTYTVDTDVDSDCYAVMSNHAVIKIYNTLIPGGDMEVIVEVFRHLRTVESYNFWALNSRNCKFSNTIFSVCP